MDNAATVLSSPDFYVDVSNQTEPKSDKQKRRIESKPYLNYGLLAGGLLSLSLIGLMVGLMIDINQKIYKLSTTGTHLSSNGQPDLTDANESKVLHTAPVTQIIPLIITPVLSIDTLTSVESIVVKLNVNDPEVQEIENKDSLEHFFKVSSFTRFSHNKISFMSDLEDVLLLDDGETTFTFGKTGVINGTFPVCINDITCSTFRVLSRSLNISALLQEAESYLSKRKRRATVCRWGGVSDRRLKNNIERIGSSVSGIPTYSWNYNEGLGFDTNLKYCGTMAQDLLRLNRSDAVFKANDGYYRVIYSNIPDVQHGLC